MEDLSRFDIYKSTQKLSNGFNKTQNKNKILINNEAKDETNKKYKNDTNVYILVNNI